NARLDLAHLLMQEANRGLAVAIYQQATKLHPDSVIAWSALVGQYARQREFAQAKGAVRSMPQRTLETASKNPGFLNSVAAVYAAEGDGGEGEAPPTRPPTLEGGAAPPPAVGTQLQLADLWLKERNYAKASQGFQNVIAKQPDSLDAWHG